MEGRVSNYLASGRTLVLPVHHVHVVLPCPQETTRSNFLTTPITTTTRKEQDLNSVYIRYIDTRIKRLSLHVF